MDNEIIKQTLIDSFEVLKDSWETKKDSIIRCIVETEAIDGDLAMDMWVYIIKNNATLLMDKNENVNFIDAVILGFNNKYNGHAFKDDICKTIILHIAPHFIRNENLIKLVFGTLFNAGYSNMKYGDNSEIVPALIACLFLQDYTPTIPILINSMANNKNMLDIRLGELMIKSNEYIDGMKNKWGISVFNDFNVSNQVKECLLSCLDLIKNKEDRSEIMLSLMAR